MTRYTVVWHDNAQNELAQLWLDASDRAAITHSANAVDQELALDASSKGIAADDDVREFVSPPLRLLFSMSEPDRLVKVLHVALC